MLVHVSVKDIALIDRVEISFEPGFTSVPNIRSQIISAEP